LLFKISFHVYLIVINEIICIILLHNRSSLLNYQPFLPRKFVAIRLPAFDAASALNLALFTPDDMA